MAERQAKPAAPPLPPVRPFDIDKTEWLPEELRNPAKQEGTVVLASIPDRSDEDEWPKPPSGSPAEPLFDPNEKPDRPGLSTDPGTSVACVPERLMTVLQRVIERYGAVRVTSTWRPPWRARRNSFHRRCQAVDFRVPGVHPQTVIAFVRDMPEVGGRKVYWNGLVHIDTGPIRTW
ncbi:YcbK family protein [Terrarubrum flagellatum]|uniref:YcbK family protein n=1 Tax=Terrirubrum flagellatum TaxID=2895980 RepID=UPI003144EBFD